MEIIKVKDYKELSEKACTYMLEKIQSKEDPVLGLATGSTPEGMYNQLIEKYTNNEVSFKNVTTFNLDEYVGLKEDDLSSYHFYMKDKLFNHIDIKKENIHLLNGVAEDLQKECEAYEASIRKIGPIDVQVLGIGENGHIGFNEPGTAFTSRTHIVRLNESTRQVNARFFESVEEVPQEALTMGIESIMDSKAILLLVSGEKKAEALARLIEGDIHVESPASILQKHDNVTVIADEKALAKVQGIV